MAFKIFFVLLLVVLTQVYCLNRGIDSSFLEDLIDAEECHRQIRAIRSNAMLLLQFSDAGLRTPRGVLTGNSVDMGNYFQCIGIDHELEDMHIQGKYCSIEVPFNQSFHLPRPQDIVPGSQFNPSSLRLDNETISKIEEYNLRRIQMLAFNGALDASEFERSTPDSSPFANTVFRLAVCVPKPCTTEQAITSFFFNVSAIGFKYSEDYCRFPGDKTWVGADYVLIVFFSLIGIMTLLSTSYDLLYRFIYKKDVKQMNILYRSFSVYTNGQRLTTFSSSGGTLQCLDGIRVLAMIWVIVGHAYSTELFVANPLDSFMWMVGADSLWITAATMTVDTFFTMAGVLLVYTTAGKMNQMSFIKNIHWFYLHRFVRITPLLAVAVIMQASYYNRMYDGPHWVTVATHTQSCRDNWWKTLLQVQNFFDTTSMCITHSWYVAIDFQLYLVSPLVLFWVYSNKKKIAWMGLTGALGAVLVASTIYCFQINLQAGTVVLSRTADELTVYFKKYYMNTLGRASPFFVGLVGGYILHIYRKKEMRLPWIIVALLWAVSAGILSGIFYFKYRIKQFDWDNQLMDNLMNSFMRPSYAFGICWLIIACVHGYSGPINWFLSLDVWRLPARLSYGMYLFHYPLMYAINATVVAPVYFSVGRIGFKFLSYLVLSLVYSFVLTLLVDSPITVLFKQFMDSVKKPKQPVKATEAAKVENIEKIDLPNGDQKIVDRVNTNLKEDISNNDSKLKNNSKDLVADFNSAQLSVDVNSDSNVTSVNVSDVNDHNLTRIDDIQIISEKVPE